MKISCKINLLCIVSLIVFGLLSIVGLRLLLQHTAGELTVQNENMLLNDKRDYLRDLVDGACMLAKDAAQQHPDNPELAQQEAVKRIAALQYRNGAVYFFIFRKDGDGIYRFILHGADHSKEGVAAASLGADADGVDIFDVLKAAALRSPAGGFARYQYNKPGTGMRVPKESFVRELPQWKWLIGTGVYVDDIAADVQAQQRLLERQIGAVNYTMMGLALLVIAVAAMVAVFLSRSITVPLARAVAVAKAVAAGDFTGRLEMKRRDEIGVLAAAIDTMPETLGSISGEFDRLAAATEKGDMSFRCDAKKFSGAYRDIIGIVNRTLDHIARPIDASLRVLDRMQFNDITVAVDETGLCGDYLKIARAVNGVRERIGHVQRIMINIADGDLDELPELEKTGRRCDNDRLLPSLVKMMQAVNLLIRDVNQ
ncbi:MAG: cache domain-containing protein, partial [Victivallales bacterium]|nr:cache domain-containing protein [Victivallales bacterium]